MLVGEGFRNRFGSILSRLLSVRNVKDLNVRSGDSRELKALDNGGERVYILEDRRILKGRRPQESGDYISYLLSRDPHVTRWLPVGKPTLIPRLHHGDPDIAPPFVQFDPEFAV